MSSAWLRPYTARDGSRRWRVYYRLGGRESGTRYAGAFQAKRDAQARRAWVVGELAALRVPDLRSLQAEPVRQPTVAEAGVRWRESRVDVAENTRTIHRLAVQRIAPIIGMRRVDELTPTDVAELVGQLAAKGYKRETIRKSITALAMILDHAGVAPNPARDRIQVRLPPDDTIAIDPPTAAEVEDTLRLVAPRYRLPLLVLDDTGMRVGELEGLEWRDLDEPRGRWRIRKELNHNRRERWVEPSGDILAAVLERVPRDDRLPQARVLPDAEQAALRTAVTRASRAAGVRHWSPHQLRHRRISLAHRQGVDWARIGQAVGQTSLRTTADRYTHVLLDDAEIARSGFLAP